LGHLVAVLQPLGARLLWPRGSLLYVANQIAAPFGEKGWQIRLPPHLAKRGGKSDCRPIWRKGVANQIAAPFGEKGWQIRLPPHLAKCVRPQKAFWAALENLGGGGVGVRGGGVGVRLSNQDQIPSGLVWGQHYKVEGSDSDRRMRSATKTGGGGRSDTKKL